MPPLFIVVGVVAHSSRSCLGSTRDALSPGVGVDFTAALGLGRIPWTQVEVVVVGVDDKTAADKEPARHSE